MPDSPLVLWWVRRDLRLADNPALSAALAHAPHVVPVFILDPALLDAPGPSLAAKRQAFLFGGLRHLEDDLRAIGSELMVRRGQPVAVLAQLLVETGAQAIYAAEDFSPYARRRDALVARHLPLKLAGGVTLHHPREVVKADGSPHTTFAAFSRAWQALARPGERELLPAPTRLYHPGAYASYPLPQPTTPSHFLPGETPARAALLSFIDEWVFAYADGRNRLDGDSTSALSPYLRFGMISAREVVVAALRAIQSAPHAQARRSAEAWLNELIWREYYCAILYHFPDVRRRAFQPRLRNIEWQNDQHAFQVWCAGRTGFPVVDAAMRQLAETGWMHNRARMITASFLVKDLLIDWRWGEQWFMRHLVDGDPAANNGGWQWVAGVGAGAAAYFRVFNPVAQARKCDPSGDYARAWIPELRRVPDAYIHEPWTMPIDIQRQARCLIGQDYPAPIVDHAVARQQALAAYRLGAPAL